MSNIKIKDQNGNLKTFNNIDTIKVNKADGSGFAEYVEGGGTGSTFKLNFTLDGSTEELTCDKTPQEAQESLLSGVGYATLLVNSNNLPVGVVSMDWFNGLIVIGSPWIYYDSESGSCETYYLIHSDENLENWVLEGM